MAGSTPLAGLAGQWCLVTGAGTGIGRAIASALASQGCKLLLVARRAEKLQETSELCKSQGAGQVEIITADLSKSSDVATAGTKALELAGGYIHVLVNNAGTGDGMGGPLGGDVAKWEAGLMLNLLAPMHLTNLLAPAMKERSNGVIINICSVAGIEPMGMGAAYAASKHGLRGWSLSCYNALRSFNIKTVCINPGYVATPMSEGHTGVDHSLMITSEDVAEAAMLALKTSATCCPTEITVRPVKPVYTS